MSDGAAPTLGRPAPRLDPDLERRLTFRWSDLPPVTHDLPGTGGTLRAQPDDFSVVELPLYEPSGDGSHAYARVEKVGRTTRDLIVLLREAGVPEPNVGVAGLKDKVARTVQWLSVPRRFEAEAWAALEAAEGVRVLETSRHRNKLGVGHLRGNRFVVRLRGVEPDALARATAVLERLARVGSPNYFGPQRFGRFGRNAVDGWRLLHGEEVPGGHRLKRFFVSALQSLLFNRWLAERVEDGQYTRVLVGDWARKHDTGGTFEVTDEGFDDAVARAEALALSATLPLYGKKVKPSAGEAGRREATGLAALDLRWIDLVGRHGDRRITRLAGLATELDAEAAADGRGIDLVLRFDLPKGSYATSVLREVMKVEVDAPLDGASSGDLATSISDDGASSGDLATSTSDAGGGVPSA
ncbi:MAG: tRNA pseudouridine(13) synthase TruD [Trueperaceae bacterium]|nr:tRNA pseudouridine(13) synthase TruD [Trueperaceae bacterium]